MTSIKAELGYMNRPTCMYSILVKCTCRYKLVIITICVHPYTHAMNPQSKPVEYKVYTTYAAFRLIDQLCKGELKSVMIFCGNIPVFQGV